MQARTATGATCPDGAIEYNYAGRSPWCAV
jgi:hypothetical protein